MIVDRTERFKKDMESQPELLKNVIRKIYRNLRNGKYLPEHFHEQEITEFDPHELIQFRNKNYNVYSQDIDPSIHRFTYRVYHSGKYSGKIVCTNCKFHMHGTDSYSITDEVNEIISRKQFSNLL